MILVDTNVISEPLRKTPDPVVIEWIDRRCATARNALPVRNHRGRTTLRRRLATHRQAARPATREHGKPPAPLFTGRVLAFDLPASQAYAELMSRARAAGLSIGAADGYIAATAAANRMGVATRDAAAFEAAGIPVVDPWRQAAEVTRPARS
jgi:predicted nucleic acid-binding protein